MASIIAVFLALPMLVAAQSLTATVTPEHPMQGDPILISIPTVARGDIASISFDGKPISVFSYRGGVAALAAIPLDMQPGEYPLEIHLKTGAVVQKSVAVVARPHQTEVLGIPASLGGNTKAAATKLVSTLAKDNAKLANLRTQDHALWVGTFRYPVASPIVTDGYGFQRQTQGYEIAHKGTDFRAPPGTPVYAMNRGVVRLATTFTAYGKTVVIDHGLGVFTFYMHLSKISVIPGTLVEKGRLLGTSGTTGYSEGPHLHISVHMGSVAVDPEAFLKLVGDSAL